jgi:hypothetical protein
MIPTMTRRRRGVAIRGARADLKSTAPNDSGLDGRTQSCIDVLF